MVEKSEKTSIVIPDNLIKFLDKNGWPTFLVFTFGMIGWNLITWLQPRFDKLLSNHFETVKSLTETQAQQVENGKKLIDIANMESLKTTDISKKVDDVHRVIVREKTQKGD
jgi:hypothetical protein